MLLVLKVKPYLHLVYLLIVILLFTFNTFKLKLFLFYFFILGIDCLISPVYFLVIFCDLALIEIFFFIDVVAHQIYLLL
jgi:hypothetical protein